MLGQEYTFKSLYDQLGNFRKGKASLKVMLELTFSVISILFIISTMRFAWKVVISGIIDTVRLCRRE